MRVAFHMTGGFAPVFRGCDLDTAQLSPAEQQEIESLVTVAKLELHPNRTTPGARDVHDYVLSVTTEAGEVTRRFDALSLPEELKPLVGFLLARSGDLLDQLDNDGNS